MRSFLVVFIIGFTVGVGLIRAELAVDFRLVKTDPASAEFIRNAVDEGRLSAAELEDRLDQLVASRKVTELARFRQAAIVSGNKVEFRKALPEVEVADGEKMPMGTTLEIEPTVGPGGLVDMRYALEDQKPVSKNKIEAIQSISSSTLEANKWEIISAWGDAAESALLLTRFSSDVAKKDPEPPTNSLREIYCQTELILCDANDIKTYERATAATRAKAIAWLRERGDLVATTGLRFRPGQKTSQKNALDWIHDNNGWYSTSLGLVISLRGNVGPFGELVDLEVAARWSPRDAPRPPVTPFAEFRHAEAITTGSTLVIEPKTRPDYRPVPVLFLTPEVRTLREGKARVTARVEPKAGAITSNTYLVHPAFVRRLSEEGGVIPDPLLNSQPRPETMLEKMGMEFPAGTRIMFIASDSQVLLIHNAKGHARFQAIIDKFDLSIPELTKE